MLSIFESMPNHAWVIVFEESYYHVTNNYANKLGYEIGSDDVNIHKNLQDELTMRAEKARESNYEPSGKFITGN